jgi:hypothetical protein
VTANADPNLLLPNQASTTALLVAVEFGEAGVVQALLELGANSSNATTPH